MKGDWRIEIWIDTPVTRLCECGLNEVSKIEQHFIGRYYSGWALVPSSVMLAPKQIRTFIEHDGGRLVQVLVHQ